MLYPVLARDPAFSHIFLFGPVPELLAPNTFYISSPGQLSNPPVTPPKILCGRGELFIVELYSISVSALIFILHKTVFTTVKI